MKLIRLYLLIFSALLIQVYCQAQSVKPRPNSKNVQQDKSGGSLNVADYDYYLVVKRLAHDQVSPDKKEYYTLASSDKYIDRDKFDYSNAYILMDVRTGKEISWWPVDGPNYYSTTDKKIYTFAQNDKILIAFNEKGRGIYENQLYTPRSSQFGSRLIKLSADWKQGSFVYNNDLWVSNFNANSGDFSVPFQVTFNGAIGGEYCYLKDGKAISSRSVAPSLSAKLVDLKTGKFTELGRAAWDADNTYISNMFYMDDFEKPGWWSLLTDEFIPASKSMFQVAWIDDKQNKRLIGEPILDKRTKKTIGYNYWLVTGRFENPIQANTPALGQIYLGGKNDIFRYHFSPSFKNMFWQQNSSTGFLYILDLETGAEKEIAIRKEEPLGYLKDDNTVWTDNTHLLVNLKPGETIDGEVISTSTQGAYIYDIITKKGKRVTQYYVNNVKDSTSPISLDAVTLVKGNYTVFVANNFLFRCRPDGSEVVQMTKLPNLYSIYKQFLDSNPAVE